MDKNMLRAEASRRLASIDGFYIDSSDRSIIKNLVNLPEYKSAARVFTYYSVGREIDTHILIAGAQKSGKRVFLPKTLGGGKMAFFEYREGGELIKGAMGIPEPVGDTERAEPEKGDIVIVPGLCFDPEGYRLGYGGGYYDRLLHGCAAFSAGLCRARMLMRAVPREEHDERVCCVVTEIKSARPV